MNEKNPGFAAVFSFVIPGMGQVYNGEFAKAFGFILATVIGAALSHAIVGLFLLIPAWIWGIIDAYSSAERISGRNARDTIGR